MISTGPLFHVVLLEPEIPNNTGNIGRTCVALGSALHLIHPLGFDVSEKACRRAGLDYWPRLDVRQHPSWPAYHQSDSQASRWFFSSRRGRPLFEVPFARGDHLVFGRESVGLPQELISQTPDRVVTLPMVPDERSLNLATAVCAALYEGVRRLLTQSELAVDAAGRLRIP